MLVGHDNLCIEERPPVADLDLQVASSRRLANPVKLFHQVLIRRSARKGVSMRDINNVALDVFTVDEPWSVRQAKALALPDGVEPITSVPAEIYGIKGRGRIATGLHADLFLFDPATVARGPKYVVHDLPAGAARITTDGLGVHGVWVNGRRIVDGDGIIESESHPGALLREFSS